MTIQNNKVNRGLIFGVPMLLIGVLVGMAKLVVVEPLSNAAVLGITLDLVVTIPLVYFFLIRKTHIPKTTVVPLFVIGLLVGYTVLPPSQQLYLNLVKAWVLPVVELVVIAYIIYKIRITIKQFKAQKEKTVDFYTTLQAICKNMFPRRVASLVAAEIAVLYYGFVYWKKRPLQHNEFSYHKNSGTIGLLMASILIVGIETFVLHSIVEKWSITAAWVLSGLSVYSIIQLLGFLKAMLKRPIRIENNQLLLHYGILSEAIIPLHTIESITLSSKDIDKNMTKKLSPLGELESHNTIITLKNAVTIYGLYGVKKQCDKMAFYIDDKAQFKTAIEAAILV